MKFYTDLFGMKEIRRRDVPDGKYTLAFLGYGDEASTRCWSSPTTTASTNTTSAPRSAISRSACPTSTAPARSCASAGAKITREPGPVKFGKTVIAFVEDPDGYKIELVQRA